MAKFMTKSNHSANCNTAAGTSVRLINLMDTSGQAVSIPAFLVGILRQFP